MGARVPFSNTEPLIVNSAAATGTVIFINSTAKIASRFTFALPRE
jgi:hypothetical protein